MKYLKKFNENISIYDQSWEKYLPAEISILAADGKHTFKKGNVMLNANMLQITYNSNEWGSASTLEFDIYISQNGKLRLDIDITFGDAVVSEFYIESPSNVGIIQYTSYHSKFDRSNTVFALEDDSLDQFISFLNKFDSINVKREDFNFLDKQDNYTPNS